MSGREAGEALGGRPADSAFELGAALATSCAPGSKRFCTAALEAPHAGEDVDTGEASEAEHDHVGAAERDEGAASGKHGPRRGGKRTLRVHAGRVLTNSPQIQQAKPELFTA